MARQSRQGNLPPLLLTRPAAQSDRFAGQALDRFGQGLRIVHSPLLAPRFLTPDIPDLAWTGLVFTSATAVLAARSQALGIGLPAYCVGEATARAATEAGYIAISASGDAGDLVELIRSRQVKGPLLHARGQDVSGSVAETLTAAGIETRQAVVYRQDPLPLSQDAIALLSQPGAVIAPVFSPRTARFLSNELNRVDCRATVWLAALSPTVAQAAEIPSDRVAIAGRPDAEGMLSALSALFATVCKP